METSNLVSNVLVSRKFVAFVNGKEFSFKTKQALQNFLTKYREEFNEIQELSVYRISIHQIK